MGMCGGSGAPTNSTVTTNTSDLPEYARPYYEDALARTGYETAQQYKPYGGQRLAYFSPMEQEAMGRQGQLGVAGSNPYLQQSGYIAGEIGMGSGGGQYAPGIRESSYAPGIRESSFQAGSLADNDMLAKYADPYYQQVLDIEKREAARQADMRHSQTGLDAAQGGSLGGYREALMRSETERNLGQLMGDIQTRGSQQAFNSARQSFEADRSARAQQEQFGQNQFGMNENNRQRAEQFGQSQFGMNEGNRQRAEQFGQSQMGMNEANRQAQTQFGLMGAQNRLQAAGMLGDAAIQDQGMYMDRLNAMAQAGMTERGMMQQGLDVGYQDYLRQQGYSMEQINFYNNVLRGTSITPGSTTSVYGQSPSTTQQLLGAGIGAAGLYGALNKP